MSSNTWPRLSYILFIGLIAISACSTNSNESTNDNNPALNYKLTVSVSSGGSVTGTGINCGTDCSENYILNTNIDLQPVANTSFEFTGWAGACTGTAKCNINMNRNQSVTASFSMVSQPDCTLASVLCVDDTPGGTQEYTIIQNAIGDASPGDTVLVYDGTYSGFRLTQSGTPTQSITVIAVGSNALIVSPEPQDNNGIRINNASYVTVEGFVVERTSGGSFELGIAARGATPNNPMKGLIVRNNTVRNSAVTNIYMSQVSESVIEKNMVHNASAQHGIYLANGGSDNTRLSKNIIYGNGRNGIHFNGDLSVGGDGLHTGITINDNIIYNNTANGLDMDGVQQATIYNNIIYKNGRHALRAFNIDSSSGPKNYLIFNNTLVDNNSWGIKLTEDEGGHTIFNNILINNLGSIVVNNPGFVSNYNITDNRFSFNGETTVVSLAQWQSAGQGAGSKNSTLNTEFVSTSSNYSLDTGANAIDFGVPILNGQSSPSVDAENRSRPQRNAYDAGALELP